MRYFFKIPVIALLGSGGAALLDEMCGILNATEDTMNAVPGVSIRNAEIELDKETQVNAEFWLVKDVKQIDFEDAMKGSDGILMLVDPVCDPGAATTLEYASIIEKSVRFLPTMVTLVDVAGDATFLDDDFLKRIWQRRVVECMAFNRSARGHFLDVIKTLLRGIIDHPEAGPVDLETAWLRSGIAWEAMARKIEGNISQEDKVYLGRTFHVLSIVAKARRKLEALVLGSIGARWLEMATEYMLAARVCEQLGERDRALFLKRKHLQHQTSHAAALHNQHKFREAAMKYQEMAYWNRNELVDLPVIEELFIRAIDSWTSIFEFDRIPDLLRQIKSPATYLAGLKDKIQRGIDYLASQQLVDKANFQLDAITTLYLKHDLRDSATELARRHVQIKLDLLKDRLAQRFIGDSIALIEEIVALRERMDVPATIPDQQLATVCVYLIENMNFHEFEKILSLVQDQLIVKQLSARRVAKEKESEIEAQQQQETLKRGAYERLLVYHKEERDDALQYARARRKLLVDMASQGQPDRAATFLGINAQWLRDLDQPDIAADLVCQVAEHLVKCGATLDLKLVLDFLPAERQQELVKSITDHIGSKPLADADVDFSKFIEYYQAQARNNHFHEQADMLAARLAEAYLEEARAASVVKGLNSIQVALAKLEKFKAVQATFKGKDAERHHTTDDILENAITFFIDTNDSKQVDVLLNQLEDLDARRRISARLVQIAQEEALKREEGFKRQDAARSLMEDLQEVRRVLLLEHHELQAKRTARDDLLHAWRSDGKLADLLPCFMADPDQMLAAMDRLEKNQLKALQFFADDDNHLEFAFSILVCQLLALKRNDLAAATKLVGSVDERDPEFKQKVTRLHAWRLVILLGKAIALEAGSGIVEAVLLAELLPLVRCERALSYLVLNKPVPPGIMLLKDKGAAGEFEKKLDEALPVIVEMVTMELEPGLQGARTRRQLLARQGKIQGLAVFQTGKNLDKAAMLYQNDAFSFFDSGDLPMGWASLWIAVMILVRERVDAKDVNAVAKNVTRLYKERKEIAENPMMDCLGLFLKCIERGALEQLRAFSAVFETLPLLDEERAAFDINLLQHRKGN